MVQVADAPNWCINRIDGVIKYFVKLPRRHAVIPASATMRLSEPPGTCECRPRHGGMIFNNQGNAKLRKDAVLSYMEAQMKIARNDQAGTITFSFEGLSDYTFDANAATQEMRQFAMMDRFESRLKDNAAISRNQGDKTITVTESMRREAVQEMGLYYTNGATSWTLKGPRAVPQNPQLVKLAEVWKCTYAEAEARYAQRLIEEMQTLVDAETQAEELEPQEEEEE